MSWSAIHRSSVSLGQLVRATIVSAPWNPHALRSQKRLPTAKTCIYPPGCSWRVPNDPSISMSAASLAVVASLALFSTASAKQWIEAADSTPTWHSILLSEQYGVFRCLDNRDGRKSLGNPVQAWECNENNNQQWRWIDGLDREGNLPAEQRAKLLDAQREHPPFIYQLKDTELCLGYAIDSVDLSKPRMWPSGQIETAKDIQLGLWPCSQAPAFFYDRATNAMHLYGNPKLPQPG